MIEIFALAACLYYPAQPQLDHCQILGDPFVYRSAEQCEQGRQKGFTDVVPTKQTDAGVRYTCMHKSVSTWQQ